MTDDASLLADLEALAADQAQHDTLSARLAAARTALATADAEVASLRRRLDLESSEVATLEGLSPTRILASLRGSRDVDLDRERAEQQAAEYAVAAAVSRRTQIDLEVNDVERRLSALAGLPERRVQALAAREQWLLGHDSGLAVELETIAARLGVAREQQREIAEAQVAARDAAGRLDQAREQLGSAQSWSTYDTFFGGGLITDMMKYDRIDDAGRLIRSADDALKRLGAELADVGLASVEGVQVTELTRTFDVWFDNIFSDWAVRDRIREAGIRVDSARTAVDRVARLLVEREQSTLAEVERLTSNRERLLLRR